MERPLVLIVEDEVGIAEALSYLLEQEGFDAKCAISLSDARAILDASDIACVILDLVLPDGNGIDLLKELRSTGDDTAIIVLTSRGEEVDRVVGLELGADDYVTKPFSARELVARVRAVLRRTALQTQGLSPETHLSVDLERRTASYRAEVLALTKLEFDLLALLYRRRGQVFTRNQILDGVWGDGVAVEDRTVDVHVKALRQKLRQSGADRELIETVRGIGYRLRE